MQVSPALHSVYVESFATISTFNHSWFVFRSLARNSLSGSLPSHSTSVQQLDLSNNLLNGSIPNTWYNWPLTELRARDNKVSSVIDFPPYYRSNTPVPPVLSVERSIADIHKVAFVDLHRFRKQSIHWTASTDWKSAIGSFVRQPLTLSWPAMLIFPRTVLWTETC